MKKFKRTIVAFTLLELTVAMAMMTVVCTSCMVLVRTSYSAWNLHQNDHAKRQMGLAVLHHINRRARQARSVLSISPATENSGSLSLLTTDGKVLVWDHNSATNEVRFGEGAVTDVLATGIDSLSFVGLKADGVQQTTEPGLIHSVQCTSTIHIDRPTGVQPITTSCQAWLRSW